LVDGLIALMNSRDGFTGPVNLGNPNEFTIRDLAEKVKRLTGSKSTLVFRELPQDDPAQRQPDIGLALKELGWNPNVQLEAGLAPTIKYFSDLLAD
jgi:UDP-glucuronate decarboxylase